MSLTRQTCTPLEGVGGGTQAANDLIMSWVWNDIASLDVLTASTNALAAAKLVYVKL